MKVTSVTAGKIAVTFVLLATPQRKSRAPLQAINSAEKADVSKTSEKEVDCAVPLKSDGRSRWNIRDKVRILCVKINFNKLFRNLY